MLPPSRSRAAPERLSSPAPQVDDPMFAPRGENGKASEGALETNEEDGMGGSGTGHRSVIRGGQIDGPLAQPHTTRASRRLWASYTQTRYNRAARPRSRDERSRARRPRVDAEAEASTSGDEEYMTEEHDDEALEHMATTQQDGPKQHADPEKTWEAYQAELATEARELARLAGRPMARSGVEQEDLPRAGRDRGNVRIKQEQVEEDDGEVMSDTPQQQSSAVHDTSYVFIKPSIEEEQEVKPTLDEQDYPNDIPHNMASDPGQLEEISAATFEPSRARRDESAMVDELMGMNIRRLPRAARSAAPRRLSPGRSATPSFNPRYKSGSVTRSRYNQHVAATYNPDVKLGEGVVRKQVIAKRKQAQAARKNPTKVPYGLKSKFMLEAEMKILVKEEAEGDADEDEDMEVE